MEGQREEERYYIFRIVSMNYTYCINITLTLELMRIVAIIIACCDCEFNTLMNSTNKMKK